jgi:hypothetical protein
VGSRVLLLSGGSPTVVLTERGTGELRAVLKLVSVDPDGSPVRETGVWEVMSEYPMESWRA